MGRAYKRALYLQVHTAEERGDNAPAPTAVPASETDVSVMKMMMLRLRIDWGKFFVCWKDRARQNGTKVQWDDPEKMSQDTAGRVIELLNQYQQGKKQIPDEVRAPV
jgi:hypothetical protein